MLNYSVCVSVRLWYTEPQHQPSLQYVMASELMASARASQYSICWLAPTWSVVVRASSVNQYTTYMLLQGERDMYRRILITLDGSTMAEQALSTALTLARQFESGLVLLRIVMPLPKSYRAGVASVAAIEAAERDAVLEAATYLEGMAASIREKGFAVQVAAHLGNPPKAIVEYVQENQIDLLVMCTRGQTGPARWLLGSVTDHVVRGSSVPVVVVPARTEGADS